MYFKKIILIPSLLLLLGSSSYKPLEGEIFQADNSSVEIENKKINYSVNIKEGLSYQDFRWIENDLESLSELFLAYAKDKGYNTADCRTEIKNLDIFMVDSAILNDKNRFNKYQRLEPGNIVWGLFDFRSDDKTRAAIILSDLKEQNYTVYAHEIAHYWEYRLCIKEINGADPESVSLDFESYLESKK